MFKSLVRKGGELLTTSSWITEVRWISVRNIDFNSRKAHKPKTKQLNSIHLRVVWYMRVRWQEISLVRKGGDIQQTAVAITSVRVLEQFYHPL